MDLRPLDLPDLEAVSQLLSHPRAARRVGRTPFDPAGLTGTLLAGPSGEAEHRLGLWEDGRLVAAAGVRPGPSRRTAHEGRLWLACASDAPPDALLDRVLEVADRWLGLQRVEIELPADDPMEPSLVASGFEVEVRKRGHRAAAGGLGDSVLLGRLRPGWDPGDATPPPPPAPRGEPVGAELSLRTARPEDHGAFARILAQPSAVWGTLQAPTAGEGLWRGRLEANDPRELRSLVAVVDGEVVGTGSLQLQPPPLAHGGVLGMTVAAEWQGRGVGRALLRGLLELGEAWLGLSRIELEVFPDNAPARRLYEAHGFLPEGVRRAAALRDGAFVPVQVMARLV